MTTLKEKVLALPREEKLEIFEAIQADLDDEPIPEPILRVLLERKAAYEAGEVKAEPFEEVMERLKAKHLETYG